jgi:hypothetical protein
VTGGYLRGGGANQAGAVISGAAAVACASPPSDRQSGQGLADLHHDKVGSQTDPAQGKGTLTLSMNQGRLEG